MNEYAYLGNCGSCGTRLKLLWTTKYCPVCDKGESDSVATAQVYFTAIHRDYPPNFYSILQCWDTKPALKKHYKDVWKVYRLYPSDAAIIEPHKGSYGESCSISNGFRLEEFDINED